MLNKIFVGAIAALLCLPAVANFEAITDGYEVTLSDVRLPREDRGTIAFKPCEKCNYETRRINSSVQWVLNGNAVSLSEFRKRCDAIDDRDDITVTISRDIESNRLIEVSINIRDTQ